MPDLFGGVGLFLLYALAFLFVLTVVVFVHELGHFQVARWCGVKVAAFSIGFGREIWGFVDRHGTRWRIAWIPLGGYVKFMDDEDVTSSQGPAADRVMTAEERAGSFHHKPLWQRALVVAAGPLANFLLAILIFAMSFTFLGVRTTLPRVDEVVIGSPAEKAGFKSGDIIQQIDGRKISSFNDIMRTVTTSSGRTMQVTVDRGGAPVVLSVAPKLDEFKDEFGQKQSVWRFGIKQKSGPDTVREEAVNPVRAVMLGVRETGFIINATLSYLSDVVNRKQSADQLGGPVRIADIAGKVAQRGLFELIYLVAFISVSVGLVNLFPIPLLDGGHLVFYAIEAVRGRPLSPRTQEISFRIGMAVVMTLMVFSFWNDIPTLKRWFT